MRYIRVALYMVLFGLLYMSVSGCQKNGLREKTVVYTGVSTQDCFNAAVRLIEAEDYFISYENRDSGVIKCFAHNADKKGHVVATKLNIDKVKDGASLSVSSRYWENTSFDLFVKPEVVNDRIIDGLSEYFDLYPNLVDANY
jgi:hypothetical protein